MILFKLVGSSYGIRNINCLTRQVILAIISLFYKLMFLVVVHGNRHH